MGHPRKADSAPSPLQLLAIFAAKDGGMSASEISRRTRYSISTILRWHEKFGSEIAFYQGVEAVAPDLIEPFRFDKLFPKNPMIGTFELGGPDDAPEREESEDADAESVGGDL